MKQRMHGRVVHEQGAGARRRRSCSSSSLARRCSHLKLTLLGGTSTHHTDAQLLSSPSLYGLGDWL